MNRFTTPLRLLLVTSGLLLLSTAHALAQTAPPILTLNEVLQSVERHFPQLNAARAEQEAAQGEALSARGAFDPLLRVRGSGVAAGYYRSGRLDAVIEQPTPLWGTTLFAGYRLGLGSFPDYEGKQETNSGGELRAGVQIPLLRNGQSDRRRANIERAEQGRVIADKTLEQQKWELMRIASHRYFDWMAAHQRLAVARNLLAIAERRDAQFKRRLEQGDVSRIDRIDNQRIIEQRRGFLLSQQRAVENTSIELSLYMRGEDGKALERLDGYSAPDFAAPRPPNEAALSEDIARAVSVRPEIARFKAQSLQNDAELRFSRNQLLPGLDLTVGVSKDLGAGLYQRMPTELEVGLSFDLPLLLRASRGKLAAIRRLDLQARFAEERIRADVKDAFSALRTAYERLKVVTEELALSSEVEQAERQKFEAGDSSLIFVNLREQTTAETALKKIEAQTDQEKAWATYQASLAQSVY